MTFVHDDLPVVLHAGIDHALARKRLEKRHVQPSRPSIRTSADASNLSFRNSQEFRETSNPLQLQLTAIDEYQRVDLPFGNHVGGDNRLAERRSRRQNTAVELLQFHGGRFLLQSKRAVERQLERNATKTFVLHDGVHPLRLQGPQGLLKATARQLEEAIAVQGP